MTTPIFMEEVHRPAPYIKSYIIHHSLNFIAQFLHTHRCSVRTSPAPLKPIKVPSGAQRGQHIKQADKPPQHAILESTPLPFTSDTTCKS